MKIKVTREVNQYICDNLHGLKRIFTQQEIDTVFELCLMERGIEIKTIEDVVEVQSMFFKKFEAMINAKVQTDPEYRKRLGEKIDHLEGHYDPDELPF